MANLTTLPPSPPEEWEEPEIPPSQDPVEAFVLPVLRARYLILLCCILGVTAGLAVALSQPNEYTSTGKLLFRAGKRESQTPDDMLDPDSEFGSARAALTDELEIIRDRENVFRKVVNEIGPDRILAPYDPTTEESPSTSGVKKLLHRLQRWWFSRGIGDDEIDNTDERAIVAATNLLEEEVSLAPVERSNVIYVVYNTHSPKLAHDVVDAFLKAARDRHNAVYSQTAKASAELARNEVELAQEEVDATERRFKEYAYRHGIADLETQKSALIQEVADVEKDVNDQARELIKLDVRKLSLEERHGKMERYETIEVPPQQVPNPEYENLQDRLNHLRKNETFLKLEIAKGGYFMDQYRKQLVSVQEEIKRVTEMVADTEPTIMTKATSKTESNEAYVKLSEDLAEIISQRDGLSQAKVKTEELLQDRLRRLRDLNDAEPEFLMFQRRAAEARVTYADAKRALDQIVRMSKLDATAELTNLQLIQNASLPNEKSGPKRAMIVASGLAGGGGLGLAIAFALAFFDRRFRRPQDIERVLGVKVLGVVPDAKRLSMPKRLS